MIQSHKGGRSLPPLFPPKDPAEESFASNVRLPQRLWDRLDDIAKAEGRSRNAVIEFFLEWACNDYEAAKSAKHKK